MTTLCASVRKKGSMDPCGSRALLGHTLCGTHARAKSVTLWVDANKEKVVALQRLQAILRGRRVRARLQLAGPCVLRRAGVCNEEDLETCESAARQHPFDYFAFPEAGKVWWFDFATIWKWVRLSREPVNPYTKVPLDVETKRRLRRMWSARRRAQDLVPPESLVFQDRLRSRWIILCQVFNDNALGTFSPEPFLRLTKMHYIHALRILRDEIQASCPSRYALGLIHRCLITAWTLPPTQFILQASYAMFAMVLHAKDEYPIAFCVLSALHRV